NLRRERPEVPARPEHNVAAVGWLELAALDDLGQVQLARATIEARAPVGRASLDPGARGRTRRTRAARLPAPPALLVALVPHGPRVCRRRRRNVARGRASAGVRAAARVHGSDSPTPPLWRKCSRRSVSASVQPSGGTTRAQPLR